MIKIAVETTIFPSEEEETIKRMLNELHIFKEFELIPQGENEGTIIRAEATGLVAIDMIYNQVRRQRTVETTRTRALECMDLNNQTCELMFNKQALSQGYIQNCSTPEESPLGPVYVTLSSNNIEELIEYLFPPTEKGRVLEPDFRPEE